MKYNASTMLLDSQQTLVNLIKRSTKTGVNRYPRFTQLMRFLQVNPDDSELCELAVEALDEAEMRELLDPDPFRATNPISPHDLPGNVFLGLIPPMGIPWLTHPDMLTNHLLLAGRSGGGKTNMILLILAQLLEIRKNDQDF